MNTPSVPELTVITPMYNESAEIEENVRRIVEALESMDIEWEYLLVDDGSTDDSLSKAEGAIGGHPKCRIIHYRKNKGRGYALRQGFAHARGRYVLTTESDLSWGASIIGRLHEAILEEGGDMVIASIYLPGGGMRNVPFSRRALSSWGNKVMRVCFGHHLTMLSGMTRIYRREVVEALQLESNRKEIHLEIVTKAQALGFHISEIPATITWAPPKPGTKGRGARGIIRFIVPHLLSSFSRGAFKVFLFFGFSLLVAGLLLSGFGLINKIFHITPPEWALANIITYGLILILCSFTTLLACGLSLQITSLYRAVVHLQAQLKDVQRRMGE